MLHLTPLSFILYHTIVIMLDRLIYWVDVSLWKMYFCGFFEVHVLFHLSGLCVTYDLYCLYHLCSLFNTFSTILGCYAMQMTVSCISSLSSKIFLSYRYRKSSWMVDNFLQCNEEKTEVLVCVLDRFMPEVMEALGPLQEPCYNLLLSLYFGCSC